MPTSPQLDSNWYILRGEMKYGPYDYRSLITMYQSGELFEYNYLWAPHLSSWTLVGELPEFSKDRLCRLLETNDPLASAFKIRQYPRREMDLPVYAHNDHQFFDGRILSISEVGALALLNDPLLLPSQKILIQFSQSEMNPVAFNVEAQIVRKNFSKVRLNVKSGLHYAVRFLQVQETGKAQLKNWVKAS